MLATCCATPGERRVLSQFDVASQNESSFGRLGRDSSPTGDTRPLPRAADFDGSLSTYLRYALEHSPDLRAQFEQWRASTERVSVARRWPEPVFTYAFFIRSVETRVGPQRHRFEVSQAIPWPTKLDSAADAAVYAASSEQRLLDATALIITRRVTQAYYELWLIEQRRKVLRDEQQILEQFSSLASAQVEVGQASLADLNQIHLNLSRLVDSLAGLEEERLSQSARLRAALGAPGSGNLPVLDEPIAIQVPAETESSLLSSAFDHPRIDALALMAKSRLERAEAVEADRFPGFVVGAQYIETGESDMTPAPADNGKDPIMVSIAVKLPIWSASYDSSGAAERAESAALRARATSARDQARAELETVLSRLRDSARRAALYETTLVPQAEGTYESVIGAYAAERSTLAAALIAERDLLDLQMGLFRAQAQSAIAWATLEEIVGRAVRRRTVERISAADKPEPTLPPTSAESAGAESEPASSHTPPETALKPPSAATTERASQENPAEQSPTNQQPSPDRAPPSDSISPNPPPPLREQAP